jgi:hypothetical protein
MAISTAGQQAPYQPLRGAAADPAAAVERARVARALYDVRSARHRRGGQAALAASVLKLSPRRR